MTFLGSVKIEQNSKNSTKVHQKPAQFTQGVLAEVVIYLGLCSGARPFFLKKSSPPLRFFPGTCKVSGSCFPDLLPPF